MSSRPATLGQLQESGWQSVPVKEEVRRNAAKGVHAVCFSEIPPNLGLPSIHDKNGHWKPFFAASPLLKAWSAQTRKQPAPSEVFQFAAAWSRTEPVEGTT